MDRFFKWLHEGGHIPKWFSWIEALTLTSALIVVGNKTQIWGVTLLGIASLVLVWVSSSYTLADLFGEILPKVMSKKFGLPIAYLLGLCIPITLMYVISLAVSALIYGS